jgi:hypothetical protein
LDTHIRARGSTTAAPRTGYVVLSGKMHVDRQETSLSTLYSRHASMMLSFISVLYLRRTGHHHVDGWADAWMATRGHMQSFTPARQGTTPTTTAVPAHGARE